jgi:hypothetical protein
MRTWLTRDLRVPHTSLFAKFLAFRVEFHASRIPLNIFADREFTMKRCVRPPDRLAGGLVYAYGSMHYLALRLLEGAFAYNCALRESGAARENTPNPGVNEVNSGLSRLGWPPVPVPGARRSRARLFGNVRHEREWSLWRREGSASGERFQPRPAPIWRTPLDFTGLRAHCPPNSIMAATLLAQDL